jgi:hypothetical protein
VRKEIELKQRTRRAAKGVGVHLRRQAVGYVALAVALGGSAYAGSKGDSVKVGGKDLKPFEIRFGDRVTLAPGSEGVSLASCRGGERAIAPGISGGTTGAAVNALQAEGRSGRKGFRPTGFRVGAANDTLAPKEIRAEVLCLRP